MNPFDVDVAACRARQSRLLAVMADLQLDLVIVTRIEHVQWLVGPRFAWTFEPAAALWRDGHVVLVAPAKQLKDAAAADEVLFYDAKWLSTLRNDQRQASCEVLLKAIAGRPLARRIGGEFSVFAPYLSQSLDAELVDIEPALYQLRRRKDLDELSRLRKAITGTGAMFKVAREIVRPGINELDVFSKLQAAAVREFSEMLTGTGNDYASGARGGPPRDREAQSGELYILDLGPAFRGYFADVTRTLAVNGEPTDAQHRAWEQAAKVFPLVERIVRPGKRCRELFDEAAALLAECPLGKFDHHLGHGIGLFPHEAPHLNPNWDDVFQEGEVFAVEPGLYGPELHAGVRLENNYLVTADSVELLSDFPLEL